MGFYWRRLGEALVFAARAGGEASVRNSYLDRAEAAFRRAFELMPLDAVNLRSLASLEIEREDALREPGERTKAISRALPYFERALVLAPASPDLFNEWSQVYFLTGDYQRAAERLARSLELAPKYVPTHMHLGVLYLRQGRLDEDAGTMAGKPAATDAAATAVPAEERKVRRSTARCAMTPLPVCVVPTA